MGVSRGPAAGRGRPLGRRIALASVGVVFSIASILGAISGPGQFITPTPIPLRCAGQSCAVLAGALSPDGSRLLLVVGEQIGAHDGPSSGKLQLQLWDAGRRKLLVTRDLGTGFPLWGGSFPVYFAATPFGYFAAYGPDDTVVLPSARGDALEILRGGTLETLISINLDIPPNQPYYRPDQVEFAPDDGRVALAFGYVANPTGGYSDLLRGGEIRVYKLETGELLWRKVFAGVGVTDIAWSPDGQRLAVTLLTGDPAVTVPRNIDNLLLFDSRSGRQLLSIRAGERAGPVCFGGRGAILTAPYTIGREPRYKHQGISFWGGMSGRLLRQLGYPGRDVHAFLRTSSDGRVLLGYVGKWDVGFSWRAMEDEVRGWSERFAVWDARDGRLLGSTPDIYIRSYRRASDGARQVTPGPCERVAMSADGSRALSYWPCLSGQFPVPMLFDLPEVPLHPTR